MDSRRIIQRLEADGWHRVRIRSNHHIFHHPTKPRIAIVPHPKKDIPPGTLRSIEKQSGLRLR